MLSGDSFKIELTQLSTIRQDSPSLLVATTLATVLKRQMASAQPA